MKVTVIMESQAVPGKEELEALLWNSEFPSPAESIPVKPMLEWKTKTAEKILAEGFRLNPEVDSIAILDDLPLGTVIQDSVGKVYRRSEGYYYDGPHDWQSFDGDFWDVIDFVMPVRIVAYNAYLQD